MQFTEHMIIMATIPNISRAYIRLHMVHGKSVCTKNWWKELGLIAQWSFRCNLRILCSIIALFRPRDMTP